MNFVPRKNLSEPGTSSAQYTAAFLPILLSADRNAKAEPRLSPSGFTCPAIKKVFDFFIIFAISESLSLSDPVTDLFIIFSILKINIQFPSILRIKKYPRRPSQKINPIKFLFFIFYFFEYFKNF